MEFKVRELVIPVLSDPDPCSEFTLGGPPPCPAFSDIPPAPPCPAFSDIPPAPDPCPGASLGGPVEVGGAGAGALAALQLQLRESLSRM
jgi:hypothetical protein